MKEDRGHDFQTRPDGGPAFPVTFTPYKEIDPKEGMSLRDWFAAHALSGFAAYVGGPHNGREAARIAFEWADAMLEARKK